VLLLAHGAPRPPFSMTEDIGAHPAHRTAPDGCRAAPPLPADFGATPGRTLRCP
jgi:hypothetical protein